LWFKRGAVSGASLLVIAAVLSANAQAQAPSQDQAQAGAPPVLEEVVVTATRRSERLINVPMSIDALSSNELTKKQIFDVKDISQLAPGLELANNDGRSNTATLRGIAFNPDEGTLPTVDIYFNEIQTDAQTAFTAIYDVDQIEVLRGPQGLLRGSSSPAGAITIKTKQPSLNTFEGYVQATGSDQDAYNIQGAVSVPIVTDVLGIRVAGLGDQNDINDVHNVTRGDSSIGHTASGRISVNFAPTDDFRSVFTYQYLRADNVQYAQVVGTGGVFPVVAGYPGTPAFVPNGPVAGVSDRTAVSQGVDEFRNQTHFLTLASFLDVGDDTLELNAGYQDTILRQEHALNVGNAPLTFPAEQFVHTPYNVASAELRYYSNGRSFWNYMIGADFIRQLDPVSVEQPSDSFISGAAVTPTLTFPFGGHYIQTPVDVSIFIPVQAVHYSVFGSSSFQLMDDLKLDVGARYQIYRVHQQSNLTVVAAGNTVLNDFPTVTADNSIRSYHAFTGGADLTYTFTPDQVGYVSYGHSFRPGSSAVGVTAPLSNNLLLSNPETSDAVELGLKSSWFNHRLNVNTDVFYQHFNGYINLTVVNASSAENGVIDTSPTLTYNGDATSEGIETQVDAVITDGWDFGIKASWANAQYNDAKIPCNTFTSSGAAFVPVGQQVSFCSSNGRIGETPKFHLTLQSEYDYNTGTEYQPFISGLFSYQPGWHSSIDNYDYEALPILNLYAGVRDEEDGWDFTLFVKNLFDTQRIRTITPGDIQQSTSVVQVYNNNALGVGTPIDSGYRGVNTTLPREIGVTLRYRFGGPAAEAEAAQPAYTPPPVQAVAPAPRSYLVFFDFNKSDLTAQAKDIVDTAAHNAGPAKVTQLTVTGHTDTVGSDAYNMRLSRRRAESVAAQLEKDGIASSEIEIVAKGKRDLLVPTGDGVREPQNRRVQIVYSGGQTS
jgi:iron complex outermembrane receptor protein